MGKDINEMNGDNTAIDGVTEKEATELKKLIKSFLKAYREKNPSSEDRVWLRQCLEENLPEWDGELIDAVVEEILESVQEYDKNYAEASEAASKGESSERWFAKKVIEASKGMAVHEAGKRFSEIDDALGMANAQMMRTVTTASGEISRCFNLDGFIAEQQHVNSFNAQAALKNSDWEARVLTPKPGETYGKNSVDCIIKNKVTGKEMRYQVKYGKDADATIALLKHGDYRNQRLLVPADQVDAVQAAFPGKTVTATLGGEEIGVSSAELTKDQVKEWQNNAQQDSNVVQMDYSALKTKDLAMHIGKNAALAGVQAAAITAGFSLAAKAFAGEKIDGDEVLETAISTGADTGVKAAVAGAMKVASEKGILSAIPKGTPASVFANIACVAIENIKILGKVAQGKMTLAQGVDKMGLTTTTMVYGIGWGVAGMKIGAMAFGWIPMVGPIIGGLAGGIVGHMAGSKYGEVIYQGAKKVANAAKKGVTKLWEGMKSFGQKLKAVFA